MAANRYGKAGMARIALGMSALCCVMPLFFVASSSWIMYPFMALYGVFNTGARLLPCAMVPDTVELDQQRTGERREGVIFGMFVFAQQTGFAAGGFILSLLLAMAGVGGTGHDAGHVTGVALAFSLGSAVLYGIAFLAILGYRLDVDRGVEPLQVATLPPAAVLPDSEPVTIPERGSE
jgi:GPH family glycoside/pentoside/hexuronide:cation symporter